MKDQNKLLRWLSQLLKSIWLFFPGILFLVFPIFCFWMLGQGKDLMVAFVDNDSAKTGIPFQYTRFFFFAIIGFWVYVSWYSSRIIAYIKKKQQVEVIKFQGQYDDKQLEERYLNDAPEFEVGKTFLEEFPRFIGNACFLILELAVLQLPILSFTLSPAIIWGAFIVLAFILHFVSRAISKKMELRKSDDLFRHSFRKVFYVLALVLLIYATVLVFIKDLNIFTLLFLLLLYHVVFIYYINLRKIELAQNVEKSPKWLIRKIMNYFCIPLRETGYFRFFIYFGIAGIILYTCNILILSFARHLGPFPTVILAFSVLLAFGNLVTAFSVKYRVNFHFILFLLAFIIGGLQETHYVRTIKSADNNYDQRPNLTKYLATWLNERNISADSSDRDVYDVYFVMANGGASRSGYWTASVLGRIEDATLEQNAGNKNKSRFSDHLFCLSGTSGGGVGVATFFSLLRDKEKYITNNYSSSAANFLKHDYFTYTFARMLGPDFFNYVIPFSSKMDRAAALEESFEISSKDEVDSLHQVPFFDNFSAFPALKENGTKINLPILFINSTRMQDGNPAVVTNLLLDSARFNNRVDVVKLLRPEEDISITSASILGARFPYLSPAGRIEDNYFVDGGYFDNSGAGVIQEIIRGIINEAKTDSIINGRSGKLYQQVRKLHFKIIHITNSPVIGDSSNIKAVAPIKNDLLSPILTIVGAYDMQTTVNDGRLINFIKDINTFSVNKADYAQIALYRTKNELVFDTDGKEIKEKSYAMNWFMSDTTRNRIDKRLMTHDSLKRFIQIVEAGLK